jgi:hypothetical protein
MLTPRNGLGFAFPSELHSSFLVFGTRSFTAERYLFLPSLLNLLLKSEAKMSTCQAINNTIPGVKIVVVGDGAVGKTVRATV